MALAQTTAPSADQAVASALRTLATERDGITILMEAIGNGLGSGIVMTMAADTAPVVGRAQFLGGFRLCGDLGAVGGPMLVSAVAAAAPLVTVCLTVGALGLAGTAWVGHWTHRLDAQLRGRDAEVA